VDRIATHDVQGIDGRKYRVARGFDDTWGSERNSSRSIVPLLSYIAEIGKSASSS
jgi:hypothetical protein